MMIFYDMKSEDHIMEVCIDTDRQMVTKRWKCHSGHLFDRK
jgi:hypothetical protein